MKVFVAIPNSDGSVEKITYNKIETGEQDATHIILDTGRNNPNKQLKRIKEKSGFLSKASMPDYEIVEPVYNEVFNATTP